MDTLEGRQEFGTASSFAMAGKRRRSPADFPVVVVGAGPVGLAAAAHLLERGQEPVILEAGETVGAAVRDWGHVAMFSPWRFNLDRAAAALLERHGWTRPDDDAFPTGRELAERYLDPLAATPEIAPRLRLGMRVIGIARAGLGKVRTAGRELRPFEVRTVDRAGREDRLFARAVVDASATWVSPNPAGAGGLPAIGERGAAASARIRYGMPDVLGAERARYAGRRVLVHLADGAERDPGVAGGRGDVPVPQEALDDPDVHPLLQEVGGEAVPQGVDGDRLVEPSRLHRLTAGALYRADRDRPGWVRPREQPRARAGAAPVGAQDREQLG
jgi:glycine/D-amino acid oxidase-like deaminating enzyme